MNGSGIFANLQTWFLQPYTHFLTTVGQQISTGLGPIVLGLGTIAIMVMASRLLLGISTQPMAEFAKTTFKIAVIAALTLNFSNYMTFVATPLSDGIPNGVSNLFNPGTPVNGNSFDNSLKAVQTFVASEWSATPWRDAPIMALVLAIVMVASVALLVGAFILTIMTKAFLFFVLTLGPVFIALIMFDATRGFFSQFLNTAVTLIIQQVLIAATASIILTNLQASVSDTSVPLLAGFNAIAFCFFSVFLVKEIPALARSLGSGGHAFAVGKLLPALRAAPEHMTAGTGWSRGSSSPSSPGSRGLDGPGQAPASDRRVGERRRTETAGSGGIGGAAPARPEMTPAAAIVAAASGWTTAGGTGSTSSVGSTTGTAHGGEIGAVSPFTVRTAAGLAAASPGTEPAFSFNPNGGADDDGWVSGGGTLDLAGATPVATSTAPSGSTRRVAGDAAALSNRAVGGSSAALTTTASSTGIDGIARAVAGSAQATASPIDPAEATDTDFVGSTGRTEVQWGNIAGEDN